MVCEAEQAACAVALAEANEAVLAAQIAQAEAALVCLQLMVCLAGGTEPEPQPGPSGMTMERLRVKSSHIFRRLADQLSDES